MPMKSKYDSELVLPDGPALKVVTDEDTPETLPQPQPVERFQMTTMADLGPSLPVGIGPERVRTFRLRPFNMGLEKLISQAKDKMKTKTGGTFVRTVLGLMAQTVGPHNFDKMKQVDRELAIGQMSMPDVLYMYLYARHEALVNEPVVMNIVCAECSVQYKWYGDLSTMDIKVLTDKAPLTRRFDLTSPLHVRSKVANHLTLGLIRWDNFCRPEFSNKNSIQSAAITASVCGMEGFDSPAFALLDTDLDDMTKDDMNRVTMDIEEHTPGPQMDITPVCPSCNHEQRMMLDWSWDNFFSRSARPSTKRS